MTSSAIALTGSNQTVETTGQGEYVGFSLRETAGATAVVQIFDSSSSTTSGKTLLDTLSFAANESRSEWYGDGIRYGEGVYVKIVSGAVEGSVRVR